MTTYDFGFRTGSPTRLVFGKGCSYMLFVGREAATDSPEVQYVSAHGINFLPPLPVLSRDSQATNSGSIDVWRGGPLDGTAGAAVSNSGGGYVWYGIESAPGQGGFVEGRVNTDSVVNVLIVDSSGQVICQDWYNGDYRILRSTDFGMTFFVADSGVVAGARLPGGLKAHADPVLTLSPKGTIILGTTLRGSGAIPPIGSASPDSADRIGYFRSSDRGSTWSWVTIVKDGEEIFAGRYYLPEDVSQFDVAADTADNVHCVFNGYHLYATSGQLPAYRPSIDVVYWSSTQGFRSLVTFGRSLPIIDQVIARSSGHALGCCYPSIALTDNASTVFCTWSQPNFTASSVDTGRNGFMMYDLWINDSEMGFPGFSRPLTNTADRSELFGTMDSHLEPEVGSSPRGRILYIADRTDGCSVLGQGEPNAEPVVYQEFFTWIDLAVRTDDRVPPNYRLEQCYPNPFNPTTTIRFSIPETGGWHRVSIEVYDILGREVGTIVYKDMQPGNYQKQWSAGRLASGVYFYVMRAQPLGGGAGRGFLAVKKMIVMR